MEYGICSEVRPYFEFIFDNINAKARIILGFGMRGMGEQDRNRHGGLNRMAELFGPISEVQSLNSRSNYCILSCEIQSLPYIIRDIDLRKSKLSKTNREFALEQGGRTEMKKWLFLLIALVLLVNLAVVGVGCKAKEEPKPTPKEEVKPPETPAPPAPAATPAPGAPEATKK